MYVNIGRGFIRTIVKSKILKDKIAEKFPDTIIDGDRVIFKDDMYNKIEKFIRSEKK